MYKQNLALDNLECLIYHKIKPNQTNYLCLIELFEIELLDHFPWCKQTIDG